MSVSFFFSFFVLFSTFVFFSCYWPCILTLFFLSVDPPLTYCNSLLTPFFFLSFALFFLSSTTGLNLYIDYFFLGIFFLFRWQQLFSTDSGGHVFYPQRIFRVVKTQDLTCSFGSFSKVAIVWSSGLYSECIAIYENCIEWLHEFI